MSVSPIRAYTKYFCRMVCMARRWQGMDLGIILGIFREIPTVHNLPFTPPVPARAWLLPLLPVLGTLPVNPAPVQLCISFNAATLELVRDRQPPLPVLGTFTGFNAATLELVQDWQAPLPVPGMVAGESCACTPMSRSELAQDRWPTLPVPARSELAQDWWPTLPVLDTVAVTLELVQDRQPPLPVLGTITGKSCICTPIHKHLHWKWFRVGGLCRASATSMNAHSALEFICNHEALFWRLSEFASVGLQLHP
ncbi:hypothetical protein B0H13DRAFT_1885758 [Mycena leptocephala]|nr:hypothetical protein B0H13DRAFT_1885758 [Mycena leptocephala]